MTGAGGSRPHRVHVGYALGSLVTGDLAERTRLMSWRIAVLALAILVSGVVAPAVATACRDTAGWVSSSPR